MAPDPATQERIYQAIKRDFLAGEFKHAERVDIKAISDRHFASSTPVREVLARLVGEQLFEHRAEGGFRPLLPDRMRLADMYAFHQHLMVIAISLADVQKLRQIIRAYRHNRPGTEPTDVARFTADLFNSIAWASANVELMEQAQRLNERLHHARIAEAKVLKNVLRELQSMTRNGLVDIRGVVGRRMVKYHSRRIEKSEEILDKF
jgi:DNA-binding GntR family transcriptional regulator